MEVGKLSAEVRTSKGKEAAHKLRAAGKIPGVVYGGKGEAIELTLDPRALQKSLDPSKRRNTVITLDVAGKGSMNVMLKEYQYHPIKHTLTHADFVRVDVTKAVQVTAPVVLTGKSQGVKDGGILHQTIRNLLVLCKPTDIPTKLEIDVTTLVVGSALHVKDLTLPAGVTAVNDPGETVVTCVAPRAEKVVAAVEGEAAEGAAAEGAPAAAGAAGAAKPGDAKAAAGAKPDAKAAAGAKPAGDAKAKK